MQGESQYEETSPEREGSPPALRGSVRRSRYRPWVLLVVAAGVLYYVASVGTRGAPETAVPWRTDLRQAAGEAAKAGKVIFVDFYAAWCGPCRVMDRRVFGEKAFAAALGTLAVPLRADVDTPAGRDLAGNYNVEAIPTYLVLSPEGRVLARSGGILSRKAVLALVRRAANKAGYHQSSDRQAAPGD